MPRLACLLVVLLATTTVHARRVTLDEAIGTAVRGNPALGAAVADVAAAEGAVVAARGLDDLTLTLSAGAIWERPRVELLDRDLVTGSIGVTVPFRTGGTVGVAAEGIYEDGELVPGASLTVAQPLLGGAGARVARAAQRRARADRDVAALAREAATTLLVRDVVVAYLELGYAAEELEIRKQAATWAREQLEVVAASVQVGKLPPSAAAEVEVAAARRDEEALLARQVLRVRSLAVARLLGATLDAEAVLLEAAAIPDVGPVPKVTPSLAMARDGNPELAAARARGIGAAIDVEVTDNGLLPTLDLAGAIRIQPGPDGAAQVGLTFQVPLGRHAARGADLSARARLTRVRLEAADVELQVLEAVIRLTEIAGTAEERVAVLARSIGHAEVDLEGERARFTAGRGSNFDVLRRQEELALVRLRLARARTDLRVTLTALGAATGDLLPRYRVAVH
jgi:outer membrane protein TolC